MGWLRFLGAAWVIMCLLGAPAGADAAGRRAARKERPAAAARVKAAPPPAAQRADPAPPATGDAAPLRRGERVEFDARLIQGQTARAGSVYLFERRTAPPPRMVRERTDFREKLVRPLGPGEGSRP